MICFSLGLPFRKPSESLRIGYGTVYRASREMISIVFRSSSVSRLSGIHWGWWGLHSCGALGGCRDLIRSIGRRPVNLFLWADLLAVADKANNALPWKEGINAIMSGLAEAYLATRYPIWRELCIKLHACSTIVSITSGFEWPNPLESKKELKDGVLKLHSYKWTYLARFIITSLVYCYVSLSTLNR